MPDSLQPPFGSREGRGGGRLGDRGVADVTPWGKPEVELEKLRLGYRCHVILPVVTEGNGEHPLGAYYHSTWGLTALAALRRGDRVVLRTLGIARGEMNS
jgi:hypothetical protein